jgi:membrane protease subunit HflC
MHNRGITLLGLGLLVLMVGSKGLYIVKETERAVLLKFGEVVNSDIQPGLHLMIPFVNVVRKFDGRVLTVDAMPERFLTLEQKAVIVDSFAKWRIAEVDKFYTATSGDEVRATGLLSQRINEGLRNAVANRTMYEVVSGERDELMENLTVELNVIARQELGVEVVDIRVKQIDLPPEVSTSVYQRMNAEREKEAREHRSKGRELAEGIRASADRQNTIIEATAYREAELLRGDGDARASATYADAFNKDPEFYAFTRSLKAYKNSFGSKGDIMLIEPNSEFFRYLKNSKASK